MALVKLMQDYMSYKPYRDAEVSTKAYLKFEQLKSGFKKRQIEKSSAIIDHMREKWEK